MSSKIDLNHTPKDTWNFKIENNILIGEDDEKVGGSNNSSSRLLEAFENNPDCVGQIDGITERETTFREMRDKSVRCALWLEKQGIKKGDVVGLCTDNHLEAYVPLLGSLYLGVVCSTWDHKLPQLTARNYLSLVEPKVLFVHDYSAKVAGDTAKELNMDMKIVVFEDTAGEHQSLEDILASQSAAEVESFKCVELDNPGAVACIVCSSGTTGFPKGTQLSHCGLKQVLAPSTYMDMRGIACIWSPTLRWQYGIMLAIKAIAAMATRVIVPDDDNVDRYCHFIEKYKAAWLATDPCILTAMLKYDVFKRYTLPSIRMIFVSGAPFRRGAQEACAKALPHVDILQVYGLTDAGNAIIKQTTGCHYGSCGFVLPGVQIKIADLKTGAALGPNQQGEIYVKTSTLMCSYYKNPEATARAIDADGWLHTGDLAYYTEVGEVYLVDRISEFILYRSINVSPAEIEVVLESHPSVYKAAVVSVLDDVDGELPIAVVAKVPGKKVTEEELIELVKTQLPDYCQLRGGVKIVDSLPRTATGKIAKNEVRKMMRSL